MRSVVYVVAALAAAGIMVGIVMMPSSQTPATDQPAPADIAASDAPAAAAPDATATKQIEGEKQTLVLHVPDMHCPFACYPAVKETLEKDASVAVVDLAEQKQEGVIDNPQVLVTFGEGFNVDTAIDSLAKRGFSAKVVQ